jgi:hypothetical protein
MASSKPGVRKPQPGPVGNEPDSRIIVAAADRKRVGGGLSN